MSRLSCVQEKKKKDIQEIDIQGYISIYRGDASTIKSHISKLTQAFKEKIISKKPCKQYVHSFFYSNDANIVPYIH